MSSDFKNLNFHLEHVGMLCRLGGCKLPSHRSGRKSWSPPIYLVKDYALQIFNVLGLKVEKDESGVHPTHFCRACLLFIQKSAESETPCDGGGDGKGGDSGGGDDKGGDSGGGKGGDSGGGDGKGGDSGDGKGGDSGGGGAGKGGDSGGGGCSKALPNVLAWMPHTDDKCIVCGWIESARKGGRPKKEKNFKGACLVDNKSQKTGESLLGVDIDEATLFGRATPSHVCTLPLVPDRFTFVPTGIVCGICSFVVDRAVESPCCNKVFCALCVFHWLHTTGTCHACGKPVLLSLFEAPHPFVRTCLEELIVACDHAGEEEFEGCPKTVALKSLKDHVTECPFRDGANKPPRYLSSSCTVSSVLTADDSLLQGDVGTKLLTKMIHARSSDGRLEQPSRGGTEVWQRIPVCRVSSTDASHATLRRRESVLEGIRQVACGGERGSQAQTTHALATLRKEESENLLRGAGLLPKGMEEGIGLAIKADLQLPWNGLRKLRRYFKLCGVALESERTMRKQLSEELPFPLVAKEEPLLDSSGTVVRCPLVCFENLVDLVLHYIELNDQAGTLVWDGLPEDELWVKVGGDHGGHSFKFSFQLVNVMHPNALYNTIPFLVFAGKDTPANLATTFAPYAQQIITLQQTEWHGKHITVSLFGDYDFMMKCYGLSGPSGVRPCLYCLSTKTEMQSQAAGQHGERTLEGLKADHASFVASGSRLQHAKHHNNVIRPFVVPIEIRDVCVPVLHLDLGIFPWLFDAMVRDAEELDLQLAKSLLTIQSSASFNEVAAKQKQLHTLYETRAIQEHRAQEAQAQLQWLLLANQQSGVNHQAAALFAAQAAALQHHWGTLQEQLQATVKDVTQLEQDLTAVKVKLGPCSSSFEPTLPRHIIDRQAYHSGAFVGNHVHKALQSGVTADIVSSPLRTLHAIMNPDGVPLVHTQSQHDLLQAAETIRQRYALLFTSYASCRQTFSSTQLVDDDMLSSLGLKVKDFLSVVRREVVTRHKRPITPKLHILEHHLVPCMKHFGVALGALGEQGGESIHHKFNLLRSGLQNTNKDVDRLKVLVVQYLTTTLPTHNKLIAPPAKRRRSTNTSA